MPEPKRLDAATRSDAADRDSQTEALLVDGLDRYFAGRYDEAIHLWTRVLFLDRSHARARAYIDRARTALAERQRRSDEMLQASHDLLDRGETDAARHLLSAAVAVSGDDEHASALRLKLERVERVHAGAGPRELAAGSPAEPVPGWLRPRRSHALPVAFIAASTVLLLMAAATSPVVQDFVGLGAGTEPLAISPAVAPLPVLSSADVAMVRARTLYSRGRLAEALVALDRVSPESAVRPIADQLRIEIQHLLLESGRMTADARRPAGGVRR
jgi:tetratricopeptide (TPR) repeat protein